MTQLKRDFAVVKHVKPPASRPDSSELYVLATGFRGPETSNWTNPSEPPINGGEGKGES